MRLSSLDLLNPLCEPEFRALATALRDAYVAGIAKSLFLPFETLRLPGRQMELWEKGVTKAVPWASAHQYGMAVDFVAIDPDSSPISWDDGIPVHDKDERKWSWSKDHDWSVIAKYATSSGLEVPVASWDPGHVIHPLWRRIRLIVAPI